MECNCYEILRESLDGQRPVDEQTFASLAVLSERLERLKKLGRVFAGVEFSPAVRKLSKQRKPLAAVC